VASVFQVKKILDKFKASYEDKYPKVQAFLSSMSELLSVYGVKLRTKLEPRHPFSEQEGAEGEGGKEGGAAAGAAEGEAAQAATGGEGTDPRAADEEGTVEEEFTYYDDATAAEDEGEEQD
jgi:hypothetical protein